jgi:hypothetical protein
VGSRKGCPNKVGTQVKENVMAVFVRLGGTAAMAEWAQENKTEFYRLYARLLPSEVTATIDIRDASELSDGELIAIIAGSGEGIASETAGEDTVRAIH